ncbi:MAG: hypothetical protein HC919_14340 [Oscillatoriales cyanobacterium SM2_2_1]|nr:hypothetical protein [Oscillatoriales cyanobacterium SM2_2_1]
MSATSFAPIALERADRALRCSGFTRHLLETLVTVGVSLRAIAGEDGYRNGYTTAPRSLIDTENRLLWLIQVGVLRREVDGQGITDSFRITPLGYQLLQQLQQQPIPPASGRDRFLNFWEQIQIARLWGF